MEADQVFDPRDGVEQEDFDLVSSVDEGVAKIATKKADKSVNTYQQIRLELKRRYPGGTEGIVPPTYDEVLTDEAHWEEVQYIYHIINKYRDMNYESIPDTNEDLVKLSAGVVRLSMLVGYAKGVYTAAESDRKIISAAMHIKIREISEELKLGITESAAQSMSRAESQPHQQAAAYSSAVHEVLQSLYYAALAFVRVLEGAAQRSHHERFQRGGQG